jgi:CheY-like chemotaxis protein
MPVMGGIECLKQIKLNAKLQRIPVIIFNTAINPRIDYKQLGATAVIPKPTRYEDLLQLLRSILNED